MWDWLDDVIDIGGDFLGGVDLGDVGDFVGGVGDFVGDFVGDNKGLMDWGKWALNKYQAGELSEKEFAEFQKVRQLGDEYSQWAKGFYDPANIQKLQSQEIGRLTEQAAPLIEAAGYGRRAQDLRRGMGRSTAADKREQAFQRDVAGLFSNTIQPRAMRNVQDTGTFYDKSFQNRLSMLKGQPQYMTNKETGQFGLNPGYFNAQPQSWGSGLLSRVLG
jgi:hypothetical protein